MSAVTTANNAVSLRRPELSDGREFVEKMRQSVALHHPWVYPPLNSRQFKAYCITRQQATEDGFLVIDNHTQGIAGVINLSVITRGALESAYLSYYVAAPYAGKGYMAMGLLSVIHKVFNEFRLHRLEANIQPENFRSKSLVNRCGFQYEGFSPKLIKVNGQWRDHERWALLNPRS